MSMTELPYVIEPEDLSEAVTTLANEMLWRLTDYGERRPTSGDVAEVLAALVAGREAFMERALSQIEDPARHLRIVPDAG